MGWLKASAKQQRLWARMTGTLEDHIIMEPEEVNAILKQPKWAIPKCIVNSNHDYVCPTIAKVSDMMKNEVFCNPFYGRGTGFMPDGNCVYYARKTAEIMRGFAFGVATVELKRTPYQKKFNKEGTLHRLNVFINNKKQVVAWEPQICDRPGGNNYIKSFLIVHMGVGLENVGDYAEMYDDEGKRLYSEYKGVF